MTDAAVHTRGLVKDYGRIRALRGVDLDVRHGEIFGFLGPNGAGKTTLIRVLLDVLRPTDGQVRVLGADPRAAGPALRARIGYLPGELLLGGRRTAGELLAYLARLRGNGGAERIEPLAERLALDLDRPIRKLSRGNKQKVGIVQAFAPQPELLVLDEPTSGLDPLMQQEVLALAREARAEGATVFFSSHVLSEVQELADRVAIIREGAIVDVDEVGALRRRAGQDVEVRFASPVAPEAFVGLPGTRDVAVDGDTIRGLLVGDPDPLLKAVAAHRAVAVSIADRELEDLFLDFYRSAPHEPPSGRKEAADAR